MRNCKTQEVKLYMSNDIYFEHYPNSDIPFHYRLGM